MSRGPVLSALWNLEVRLQFTGWLQFLLPAILGLLCLSLAGGAAALGLPPAALVWPPLALGVALQLNAGLEVLTLR